MTTDDNQLGPVARRLAATQRVLCVEDEPDIAVFLRAYFRAAGYDFAHVDPDNVDAVMAAIETAEPDIILLDLRLRGFSGMDAYRHLRARVEYAFMPIILVSAHADTDPAFERPKGIDAFVGKPFNIDALADLVAERLAMADALAQAGHNAELEVMTQQYLEARLADEVAVAGVAGSFSFGLIRLTSMDEIIAEVGREGRDYVVSHLIRNARAALPPTSVFGLTDGAELAVILPGTDIDAAEALLAGVMAEAAGSFPLVGGATARVTVAGGIAAFPTHAGDIDELFMAADAALAVAVDRGQLLSRAL